MLNHAAPTVEADDFKAAFRRHAAGVALITADNGEARAALTATSVHSVSVDPNLLVFSVSDSSSSAPVLTTADHVLVHLLDADGLDLAVLGATSGIDRFADTSLWTPLATGEPLFNGALTWIRARVVSRIETGTATVVVAEAVQVSLPPEGHDVPPLVHHNRTWHRLTSDSQI